MLCYIFFLIKLHCKELTAAFGLLNSTEYQRANADYSDTKNFF